MTADRWQKLKDWYGRAMELQGERLDELLSEIRSHDAGAADELVSLLAHTAEAEVFLPDLGQLQRGPGEATPEMVGAWRLLRLLGHGGMGQVYLAERADGAFQMQAAVKLLQVPVLRGEELRRRFERERRILARLDHPNIARLLDGGIAPPGVPYLVMEYVNGQPIGEYVRSRRLSDEEIAALGEQVCAGLAHAHRNLVIHRDIKPANVMVTPDGRVKLLDFGIAKLLDAETNGGPQTQLPPATPLYASPEQLRGLPVTTASDVYSTGVLLYELMAGCSPYAEAAEAYGVDDDYQPAPPSRRSGRRASDLDRVVLKALRRDAARRYASAELLGADLERFRRGYAVSARPDTLAYRAGKFVRRNPIQTLLAVLLLAVLSASGVVIWLTGREAQRQAASARRRFDEVRQLAQSVLNEFDATLAPIPGTTAPRKLLVETALRYLDNLAREAGWDAELRNEIAAAYLKVGNVQGGMSGPNLGDSAGAAASFDRAIALLTGAGGESGGRAARLLLMDAYTRRAALSPDPAAPLGQLQRVTEIGAELIKRNPRDAEVLRVMATAEYAAATSYHLMERALDQERHARVALDLYRRMRDLRPGSTADDRLVARALNQLALAKEKQAEYEASLQLLAESEAILREAIGRAPADQLLQRDVAEVHSRRGSVLVLKGRAPDALPELGTAMAILAPIVARDPENIQYRRDLSYAHFRRGEALRALGRRSEALREHAAVLSQRRVWAEHDAANTFVGWEYLRSLNAVASLSPRAEAAPLYRVAIDRAQAVLAKGPNFNEVRREQAAAWMGLSTVLNSAAEREEALRQAGTTMAAILRIADGDRRVDELRERLEKLVSAARR